MTLREEVARDEPMMPGEEPRTHQLNIAAAIEAREPQA